jgi:SAM-dependent methyltransferase
MKMGRVERFLVNSRWSKRRVLGLAKELLGYAELDGKQDFLEVGCGNGVVSRYLADKYQSDVVGIDIDPEQIALAAKDVGDVANIRFLEADATRLPFEAGSFDVVLSFGVMHHIDNWLAALGEIKRVLRPKGYFIYADILYPGWIARLDRLSGHGFGLVTVRLNDVDSFIKKNNFSTVYARLKRAIIHLNYEAVYRRN